MTGNSPESVEAIQRWLVTARLSPPYAMCVRAVLRVMPDARTLADLENKHTVQAALVASGLKPATAGMYVSRFIGAVRRFRGTYKAPVRGQPRAPTVLPPELQLADALACLERWPILAPYLRGGLAVAAADILGVSREAASPSGQP